MKGFTGLHSISSIKSRLQLRKRELGKDDRFDKAYRKLEAALGNLSRQARITEGFWKQFRDSTAEHGRVPSGTARKYNNWLSAEEDILRFTSLLPSDLRELKKIGASQQLESLGNRLLKESEAMVKFARVASDRMAEMEDAYEGMKRVTARKKYQQ